jgi:hypothetical protein
MARVEITSVSTGGGGGGGNLQLLSGASMTSTLTAITDTSNVQSQLRLSTNATQVVGTLQITTNNATYLDAEDGTGNNRFTIGRDPSSQQVNVDFASNPTGSTTAVGAIRTYRDGTNLSEVMTFREDGNVGIGTTTPVNLLSIDTTNSTLPTEHSAAAATIKSSVQSPLRVLRTGSQPNIWIGTSSTTPNVSAFLFGIRTGAYYNTATPTYSGDYAPWIVSRGNDWGTATLATDLRMSQGFTCNGNTGRTALAIYPIPVETATNTDMVNMNNLLIATAGLFTAQPLARLQIIGDGSTSATTSLLVENSAATQLLRIKDDGEVKFADLTFKASEITGNPYFTGIVYAPSFYITGGTANFGASAAANASAQLELTSTTKGFLPPRMTNAQKNAIASPAEGLIVHDTTNNGVAYYDGTTWGYLSGAKQTLTGSGGTLNIPFRNGNIVDLALNASTTLTFGSHVVGTYIIEVTQGGGGSNTLTYPASVKWSGGTPPTLTTAVGKTDILTFFHDGTFFYGTYSLNY